METVKVSSKGQIVIPKSLRDAHHIHAGDRFIVSSVAGELHLKPASAIVESTLKSVAGMLHRTGAKKLAEKEIERRIKLKLLSEDAASKTR
ncbi:MAG: AbrB/MazE/SpoVT family DNA-binding domain-containing protein [Gallionellaceae bacterium]